MTDHHCTVMARISCVLTEAKIAGTNVDRAQILRRYPAHRAQISALWDEIFRSPDELPEPRCAEAPPPEPKAHPSPPSLVSQPAPLETPDLDEPFLDPVDEVPPGAPAAPDLPPRPRESEAPPEAAPIALRSGAHGTLFREPDGHLTFLLPNMRLAPRTGPAHAYLERARSLERASAPGVQTPNVETTPEGDVLVRFNASPTHTIPFSIHVRGGTLRALTLASRIANSLERLHAAASAHGRLRWRSIRRDPKGRLWLDSGLADGPGKDVPNDLPSLQTEDIRALGALLYGALAQDRPGPTDVDEILTRHRHNELPSLRVRRPRLLPAVCRTVQRALDASHLKGSGFTSMRELAQAIQSLLDLDTESGTTPSRRGVPVAYFVGAAALVTIILILVFNPI